MEGDKASVVCQTVSASLRLSLCQTRCSLGTHWGDPFRGEPHNP